jgi:hypothetical protein
LRDVSRRPVLSGLLNAIEPLLGDEPTTFIIQNPICQMHGKMWFDNKSHSIFVKSDTAPGVGVLTFYRINLLFLISADAPLAVWPWYTGLQKSQHVTIWRRSHESLDLILGAFTENKV